MVQLETTTCMASIATTSDDDTMKQVKRANTMLLDDIDLDECEVAQQPEVIHVIEPIVVVPVVEVIQESTVVNQCDPKFDENTCEPVKPN